MTTIELNGKEYLLSISIKVMNKLREHKNIDVLLDEKMSFLDQYDVISYATYEGLKVGAAYNGDKLDLTEEQFEAVFDTAAYLEGQNALISEILKASEVMEKRYGKKKQDRGQNG